jgi:hypothetical protein
LFITKPTGRCLTQPLSLWYYLLICLWGRSSQRLSKVLHMTISKDVRVRYPSHYALLILTSVPAALLRINRPTTVWSVEDAACITPQSRVESRQGRAGHMHREQVAVLKRKARTEQQHTCRGPSSKQDPDKICHGDIEQSIAPNCLYKKSTSPSVTSSSFLFISPQQ